MFDRVLNTPPCCENQPFTGVRRKSCSDFTGKQLCRSLIFNEHLVCTILKLSFSENFRKSLYRWLIQKRTYLNFTNPWISFKTYLSKNHHNNRQNHHTLQSVSVEISHINCQLIDLFGKQFKINFQRFSRITM